MKRDPEKHRAWQRRSQDKAAAKAKETPRKRLKPVSDKREAEKPERDRVREIVWKRDGGKCRIAPFLPDQPCMGELHPHHVKKASALGAYSDDNLMLVCDFHNDWVENNPIEAEALGLVDRSQPPVRQHLRVLPVADE